MPKQAGCKGRVQVDGLDVHVSDWNFNSETDFEDATDTVDDFFEDDIATFNRGTGAFNLFWNSDNMPTLSPPNLNSGVKVVNLFLFLGDTSDKVDMPLANILNVGITSEVKGLVKFSCAFKAAGTFTMPS